MKKLLILGANNPESLRIFDAVKAKDPQWELLGYLDNDPAKQGKKFGSHEVLGGSSLLVNGAFGDAYVVNAITRDCMTRKKTTEELRAFGARLTNLVHPSVDLGYVKVGSGIIIHEHAIIQPMVELGDNCAINCGCIVSHECKIGEHCFLAPGCVLAGIVTLGEGVMVGAHATILPRLRVGKWSIVGAGAVVTRNVPPYSVVAGNPAKLLRKLIVEEREQTARAKSGRAAAASN